MAHYQVTAPDGHVIDLEGPDNATDEQILAEASKVYKPKKVGVGAAAAQGFNTGLLSNFDDEYGAALQALFSTGGNVPGKGEYKSVWKGASLGDAYRTNLANERRFKARAERDRPVTSGISNLGGGVAQTALGAKLVGGAAAVAPTTVRSAAGQAAAAGGMTGMISGAGAGEGGIKRLRSAAAGGVTGAVLGGAIGATVAGLGPAVAKYASAMRGKNVTPQALASITKSLANEGYDVTSAAGRAALQQELSSYTGKPVSLADLGAATRARTGVALRTPSKAQAAGVDVVERRAAGASKRLQSDVLDTVAPRADVQALDDALIDRRAQTALPLRQAALTDASGVARIPQRVENIPLIAGPGGSGEAAVTTPKVVNDEILQNLARVPSAKKALTAVKGLRDAEYHRLSIMGQDTSHLPEIGDGAPLDMKGFDALKRHLDDEIDAGYSGKSSYTKAEVSELKNLRDNIRDRMKMLVPEYGDYLENFGDVAQSRKALAAGEDFESLPPEVIAKEQGKRSVEAQELYRVGGARNLLDRLRSTTDGRTPSMRIVNDDIERDQLAAMGVQPPQLEQLNTAVDQERTFNKLKAELQGSGTDARMAARADADGAGVPVAVPFNPASPVSWIGAAGRKVLGATNLKYNAKINEQLLPRMLEQDPQAIKNIISELEAQGQIDVAKKLKRAVQSTRIGLGVGNVIGGPVSLEEEY